MINDTQKAVIRDLFMKSREPGYALVTFYQDHFYTRNRKFGYPVCIQLQNLTEKVVENSRTLAWSSSPTVCENLVAEIDAYISELESEQVQP